MNSHYSLIEIILLVKSIVSCQLTVNEEITCFDVKHYMALSEHKEIPLQNKIQDSEIFLKYQVNVNVLIDLHRVKLAIK